MKDISEAGKYIETR